MCRPQTSQRGQHTEAWAHYTSPAAIVLECVSTPPNAASRALLCKKGDAVAAFTPLCLPKRMSRSRSWRVRFRRSSRSCNVWPFGLVLVVLAAARARWACKHHMPPSMPIFNEDVCWQRTQLTVVSSGKYSATSGCSAALVASLTAARSLRHGPPPAHA